MTTEQRLERLERENRWMRRIGAAVVGVAAVVFLIGQGQPEDAAVKGTRLELYKPDKLNTGGPYAYLALMSDGAPQLAMFDAPGTARVDLGVQFHDAVGLKLRDTDRKGWANLAVMKNGAPRLHFVDRGQQTRVWLGVADDGSAKLEFRDRQGRLRTVVGCSGDGPLLSFFDKDGKVIWKAPKD